MSVVRPFCCIHPAKGLESRIAALPYDVYNREEARAAVAGKPLSFLNIDRPETMFGPKQDMYAPDVYKAAQYRLWKMSHAHDQSIAKQYRQRMYKARQQRKHITAHRQIQ